MENVTNKDEVSQSELIERIVIMATTSSPVALDWVRPWAVFTGTMKQAKAYCDALNKKAKSNYYEPVKVKTAAP